MQKGIIYPVILIGVAVLCYVAGLDTKQIASVTIFASLIVGTLMFWRFRLAFALVGVAAMLGLNLLNIELLIEFAGLDIILFLVGMMIVIGFLEEKHFFEHLLEKIQRRVGNNPKKLVIVLMLMSAMFAALVDEVTSILFMTSTVLHLTSRLKVSAVPLVLMTVFATNIGSSATVVGNPVGVLIALRAELTFLDFLRWATPISLVGLAIAIPLCLWYFKPELNKMYTAMKANSAALASEFAPAKKKESYLIPWIIFLGTIGGLVSHGPLEEILGLEKNALLPGTAFFAAGVVLFLYRDKARELVERRVDWWTLSFFLFLFASVGTMKMLGITTILANSFLTASGGNETVLFFIFTPIAGVLSAFMDNVLAVAVLIPVVQDMGELGINNYPLWWAMLFGGTFFGNLTLIGSTANIVAIGMLERRNEGHITLKQWIKPGMLISIPTLLVAMILLYIQIPLMPT